MFELEIVFMLYVSKKSGESLHARRVLLVIN